MAEWGKLTYRELIAPLIRCGYYEGRSGRHPILVNRETGHRVPIPSHSGGIPNGIVRGILRLTGLTVEQFLHCLGR